MDKFEFIASLVNALAWPTAVVFITILLRDPIIHLLHSLVKLKHGDWELIFERALTGIAEGLKSSKLANDNNASKLTIPSEVEAVAKQEPRAVIPLTWAHVESALRDAVGRVAKSSLDVPFSTSRKVMHLHRNGYLDDETAKSIDGLYKLRNRLLHGDLAVATLSEGEALEYAALAGAAAEHLRRIKP